jgi:sugar lactone lactonase YvrE
VRRLPPARLVARSRDVCGESALWEPASARLLWLDLYRPTFHCFDPASGRHAAKRVDGADRLACLLRAADGHLPHIVSADAIGRLLPSTAGAVRFEPERPIALGSLREAVNDGKTHPCGAIWLGTADRDEREALGRVRVLGANRPLDPALIVANGPSFAPDGRAAYVSDSAARRILRYPVGTDGLPAGPAETLATFEAVDGFPDGSTVDRDGRIWVAMWDGAAVRCLSPEGATLAVLPLPVARVTSCAFGGADLATLFITTASFELDDAAVEAGAGALFAAEVGARGIEEPVARL